MTVENLLDKTNITINLIFYYKDDEKHTPINYDMMCREDYIDFLDREIYMIYPTKSVNTLEVALLF